MSNRVRYPSGPLVNVVQDQFPKGEESFQRLLAAGKLAAQTKQNYVGRVRAYIRLTGRAGMTPDEFLQEIRRRPKRFEEEFIRFIGEASKRSATSTVAFWRDSLRRFVEINRVGGIDWDYVNQFLPKVKKSGQDRAPTLEEIRRIVAVADLRTKCLILFLVSSGARIGSIDYLRWKDLQETELEGRKMAKVTIYAGEPEEYYSFVSPEAWEYLLRYRERREGVGEKVVPLAPVFIMEYDKREFKPADVKPVKVRTLKAQLGVLLGQIGLRTLLVERPNYKCYEWKQAHGFRKFFKTRMEVAGVKPLVIETLMGHSTGVSSSYFKPTEKEMLAEYSKGMENVTVLGLKATVSEETVLTAIRRELLSARYSDEEIAGFGDLSKLSKQQFVEILDRKALGLNGHSSQKVVPLSEVKSLVEQGWEYVSQLPDGYTIVRLPKLASGS